MKWLWKAVSLSEPGLKGRGEEAASHLPFQLYARLNLTLPADPASDAKEGLVNVRRLVGAALKWLGRHWQLRPVRCALDSPLSPVDLCINVGSVRERGSR